MLSFSRCENQRHLFGAGKRQVIGGDLQLAEVESADHSLRLRQFFGHLRLFMQMICAPSTSQGSIIGKIRRYRRWRGSRCGCRRWDLFPWRLWADIWGVIPCPISL